jgi:hypothetical protein
MSDADKSVLELALEVKALRRRLAQVDAPGQNGGANRAESEGRPFAEWDSSFAANSPSAPVGSESMSTQSVALGQRIVASLDAVPAEQLQLRDIQTAMVKPRTLAGSEAHLPWYPQLTQAALVRLANGYLGDNVIFDHERYYSFSRWWLGTGPEIYAHVSKVEHIEAGISIAAWGGEAFQHFALDAIPRLAAVLDVLERPGFQRVRIVSHREGVPFAEWFWRKMGLADRVVQKPISASETDFVIQAGAAFGLEFAPVLPHIGLYPRNLLRPVQRRLGLLEPAAPESSKTVLYLHREAPRARSVANVEDLLQRVEERLRGSGYRLEVFQASEDYDVDCEVVSRAKLIFGPHGGDFGNLVFARPGTHVIEFLPVYRLYHEAEDPLAMYWGLAQAAGLHYWTVDPPNFDWKEPEMVVDAEEVVSIIACALAL